LNLLDFSAGQKIQINPVLRMSARPEQRMRDPVAGLDAVFPGRSCDNLEHSLGRSAGWDDLLRLRHRVFRDPQNAVA
jgi:hypothetical protein